MINENSDIEDKYLIIANLFTGNLLMAVKGAYKGEIFLLEDGEEEEYIPIAKNILSFIEQIAANL